MPAEPASAAVDLPRIIDLDALDSVQEHLLDALQSGGATVEAGAVERVSTNALFMLLSGGETALRAELAFEIKNPSDALRTAITRLGLGDAFAPFVQG